MKRAKENRFPCSPDDSVVLQREHWEAILSERERDKREIEELRRRLDKKTTRAA